MEAVVKSVRSLDKKKENQEIKDVAKDIILPFLPAKTLFRLKSVSKEWEEWISSPFLAHQQSCYFKNSSGFFYQNEEETPTFVSLDENAYGVPNPSLTFLPERINILSSCNGLLLCQGYEENNSYYICNPATQQWRKLPPHNLYHGSSPAIILVFEPSLLNMAPDYHLICAVPFCDQPVVIFEAYSSVTKAWTILDNSVLIESGDCSSFTGNGFYMKGIAYWETSNRTVLAFNPIGGVHEMISLPVNDSFFQTSGVLAQIDGELGYISVSARRLKDNYSVRIYSGMQMSLKCMVKVNLESAFDDYARNYYWVLPCLDGNSVMILVGGFVYSCRIDDGKVEVVSRAETDYAAAANAKCLAYVNSLVHVS